MYELQKASFLKRISAYLLDIILVAILSVGFGYLFSKALNYDEYNDKMLVAYDEYQKAYGIVVDVLPDSFEELSEEEKVAYEKKLGIDLHITKEEYRQRYVDADNAMSLDDELRQTYSMILNISLITATFGVLLSFLVLEFGVPMLLKNGQTVGKKVFAIGVMQITGIKISPFSLFVRAILGKYTVGTMIPILCAILIFFNAGGSFPVLAAFAILVAQVALVTVTRNNYTIHDMLSSTVVVDMQTQMIFPSKDALLEHQKKLAAEKAEDSGY